MVSDVGKGGDAPLVDGSEIYEEHVLAASPTVYLLESALEGNVWIVLSK